jgi:transcriptional regulator GlxA family with amidase domain
LTPYQYHVQMRLVRAKSLLRSTTIGIREIARSLGFESAFHFTNSFRARTGVSPSQWRKGQNIKGEVLPAQIPGTQRRRKARKSAKSSS